MWLESYLLLLNVTKNIKFIPRNIFKHLYDFKIYRKRTKVIYITFISILMNTSNIKYLFQHEIRNKTFLQFPLKKVLSKIFITVQDVFKVICFSYYTCLPFLTI